MGEEGKGKELGKKTSGVERRGEERKNEMK